MIINIIFSLVVFILICILAASVFSMIRLELPNFLRRKPKPAPKVEIPAATWLKDKIEKNKEDSLKHQRASTEKYIAEHFLSGSHPWDNLYRASDGSWNAYPQNEIVDELKDKLKSLGYSLVNKTKVYTDLSEGANGAAKSTNYREIRIRE